MTRLPALDPAAASGRRKELLDDVEATFGATPNLFRTAANSEAALAAMLDMFKAVGSGTLGPQLVEKIAIAVSEVNGCSYCLSAHTAIGRLHGISDEELVSSRGGLSSDAKTEAALRFAEAVTDRRGAVDDEEYERVRAAGWSDAEIAEILANVALNTFTNYFAVASQVEIDFPPVHVGEPAAA